MNKNNKIKLVAGCTAFSLIFGGYTLVRDSYKKLDIIVDSEETLKNNKCELNVINNVLDEVNVKLIDANGHVIDTWIQNDNPHHINNLSQGLYTIECQSDSFSFIEENVAINFDICTEIYICNGYLMIGYCYNQDNTVSYNSKLVLAKRK